MDAAITLGAGLSDEAVVSAAERNVEFGIVRKVNQEQRRVDDLSGDAEAVHVGQPAGDVGHVAASDAQVFAIGLDLRRRRRDQAEAAFAGRLGKNIAVDKPGLVPIAVQGIVRQRQQHGTATVHFFVEHRPHLFGFGNMGVGVDDRLHGNLRVLAFGLCSVKRLELRER